MVQHIQSGLTGAGGWANRTANMRTILAKEPVHTSYRRRIVASRPQPTHVICVGELHDSAHGGLWLSSESLFGSGELWCFLQSLGVKVDSSKTSERHARDSVVVGKRKLWT
jgi:hypothetical protein